MKDYLPGSIPATDLLMPAFVNIIPISQGRFVQTASTAFYCQNHRSVDGTTWYVFHFYFSNITLFLFVFHISLKPEFARDHKF